MVVQDGAMALARRVADRLGWAYYPLDEARDVARLVFNAGTALPLVCDIAAMRGGSIEADLSLRDFTINAMALAFESKGQPQFIDVVDGRADLAAKVLRRVSPVSLADDPVRLLRAVRLAAQLGLTLEPATEAQIRRLARSVSMVSAERLRDELWKIVTSPAPAQAIDQLRQLGLLVHVLPEVAGTIGVTQSPPHVSPVYEHTLATISAIHQLIGWILEETPLPSSATYAAVVSTLGHRRDLLRSHLSTTIGAQRRRADWLLWMALLHDIGKPATRTEEVQPSGEVRIRFFEHEDVGARLVVDRLTQLRFNRFEIDLVAAAVRSHMRPHHLDAGFDGQTISRRAGYRFFRDTAIKPDGIGVGLDLLILALADRIATFGGAPTGWSGYLTHVDQLLEVAFSRGGPAPRPLVDGHLLMSRLALPPGPKLGAVLDHILEAQVAGEISTPEEALELAAGWVSRHGA
jgi:poly(A) polymerase/tRNA nucleotidyltransferase (CCA-adding enzyme)